MNKPALIKSILIVIALSIISESAADQNTQLNKFIDQTLSDPAISSGIQGVRIESLKDGRVLYNRNGDSTLIPASCLKLIISAASLDQLGPDYKISTKLYMTGKIAPDGTLKGSIILVGNGDPVLKSEDLEQIALKIQAKGIKKITGGIIGDDTAFSGEPLGPGWPWDCEQYSFMPQISALNLNENAVEVWVTPGKKAGEKSRIRITPLTGYVYIINECTTAKSGTQKRIDVTRIHGRNTIKVTGTIPIDYKPSSPEETIAIDDPTMFTCKTLAEILERKSITITGSIERGIKPQNAELIASHDSPALAELLSLMNKPSDNLIAECLLRTLGLKVKGKGTTESGVEVEEEFLKKIGADLKTTGITDGSGMARTNLISANNIVILLKYMSKHRYSAQFIDSLPIAGVDGNLARRLKNTAAQGNLKAKTGYLYRISSISGYVTTKSGETLAFSILMNNHLCKNTEAKTIQDKILEALANL